MRSRTLHTQVAVVVCMIWSCVISPSKVRGLKVCLIAHFQINYISVSVYTIWFNPIHRRNWGHQQLLSPPPLAPTSLICCFGGHMHRKFANFLLVDQVDKCINGYQFSVIHFQHVHHAYQVFHAPLIIFQANVKTREHTQPEPEFLVYWYGSQ